MVFTSPALPDTQRLRPADPVSRGSAGNGAGAEHQDLLPSVSSMGALRHGKVGTVRVGIGMRCVDASLPAPPALLARALVRGSVPGRGSDTSWCSSHICMAPARARYTGAVHPHRRWGTGAGQRVCRALCLFMTLRRGRGRRRGALSWSAWLSTSARNQASHHTATAIHRYGSPQTHDARCRAPSFAFATAKSLAAAVQPARPPRRQASWVSIDRSCASHRDTHGRVESGLALHRVAD